MLMTWVQRDQCSVSNWLILGFEFSRASGIQSGKDTDRFIYVIIVKFFGSNIGPRPYYGREMLSRSCLSTVRPVVHTNPSRQGSFSKKPGEFVTAGFAL